MPDNDKIERVNRIIQSRLARRKNQTTTPVEASEWFFKQGLISTPETRKGLYIRRLCRKGLIKGAEQKNKKWIINLLKD